MTNDTYGPTSGELFATYDPDSSCWKTSPGTDPSASTEFSETWPRTGSTRNGAAYRRPTPDLATDAIACLSSPIDPVTLLPTIVASDAKGSRNETCGRQPDSKHHSGRTILDAIVTTLLPTPAASDGTGGGVPPDTREGRNRQLIDWIIPLHNGATTGPESSGGQT
jgi:hypothetical protein